MSRKAQDKRPILPKVREVSLDDRYLTLRIGCLVLMICVAVTMFAVGISSLLSKEPGWQEISVSSAADAPIASEFSLTYNLGAAGASATVEAKALTSLYTTAMNSAYEIFSTSEEYEDVQNLYYLNSHPGEVITVDAALYAALEAFSGSRLQFYGGVYRLYQNIFLAADDLEASYYDPALDESTAEYLQELVAFASDEEAVSLALLGGNTVCLCVSEEYAAFAAEYGLTNFVDFSYLTNAVIADYVADELIAGGYTLGILSSMDGFHRSLGDSGESYSLSVYALSDSEAYPAATLTYSGAAAVVSLRVFALDDDVQLQHYTYADGTLRYPYFSLETGEQLAALDALTVYSNSLGCTEVALQALAAYIAPELDPLALAGLGYVYCDGSTIHYNDSAVTITDNYEGTSLEKQIVLDD